MTSGKGYRHSKGYRQVLEELHNEGGAQFDPRIVEAFSALMTRKGERG
jgi:HD-GYP domain-containing protein (c-di-GMP phosphodiesterase class II)